MQLSTSNTGSNGKHHLDILELGAGVSLAAMESGPFWGVWLPFLPLLIRSN